MKYIDSFDSAELTRLRNKLEGIRDVEDKGQDLRILISDLIDSLFDD